MNQLCRIVGIMLIATGATTVASAQINVPGVPLPQLPRLPVGTDPVTGTLRTATSALTEARKLRVREILRTERATVESDPDGQPILRRQVGALSPTPAALEGARRPDSRCCARNPWTRSASRSSCSRRRTGCPRGTRSKPCASSTRKAQSDYNHLYLDAGAESEETAPCRRPVRPPFLDARIGLIDSGVDGAHPALADAKIVRDGCEVRSLPAPQARPSPRSSSAGARQFESILPGATLYAVDISAATAAAHCRCSRSSSTGWHASGLPSLTSASSARRACR